MIAYDHLAASGSSMKTHEYQELNGYHATANTGE
jgi:hypothetical protein